MTGLRPGYDYQVKAPVESVESFKKRLLESMRRQRDEMHPVHESAAIIGFDMAIDGVEEFE